jgi:transcriptional regulator with XRE-family HTH domain
LTALSIDHLGFSVREWFSLLSFAQKKEAANSFLEAHPKQPRVGKERLQTMLPDAARSGSRWSSALVRELTDAEFRHEYMADQVRSWIAFQIRALREQRRWNQADLARESGKTQSVISRVEDPDYGKLSLQTCLELAAAYDLPLLVQFVEWDDWLSRMSNMSPSALRKRSFDANRLLELHRRTNRSAAEAALVYSDGSARSIQTMGLGSAIKGSSSPFSAESANEDSEGSFNGQVTIPRPSAAEGVVA